MNALANAEIAKDTTEQQRADRSWSEYSHIEALTDDVENGKSLYFLDQNGNLSGIDLETAVAQYLDNHIEGEEGSFGRLVINLTRAFFKGKQEIPEQTAAQEKIVATISLTLFELISDNYDAIIQYETNYTEPHAA